MNLAMIISCVQKSTDFLTMMLKKACIDHIEAFKTCAEASMTLSSGDVDLVVVNAPLKDGTGLDIARQAAAKSGAQVILIVKNEHYETLSADNANEGILIIPKPINKTVFEIALTLTNTAHKRIKSIQDENRRLTQKLSDIRIIDRAKFILVSLLNMSEKEAHRYIEKQAMDMRASKRTVAEGILKTYEN